MHSTFGMAAAFRAYCQQAVRLGCSTAQPLPVPVQVYRPSLPCVPAAAASSTADSSISLQQRSCARKMGGFMAPRRHLQHATDRSAVLANYVETDRRSSLPATAAASGTGRLRVAVDVDEVLGRFVFALNVFCKEKYGLHHSVSDYWVYEFAKIWGCTRDQSNEIVHDFFKSSHFEDGIPVIDGAYNSLERLSDNYDLLVVTSRQHVIERQTLDWIDRHFPGIFQKVYFGNHWSLSGPMRKKSDICKSIGAQILIDDNPTYAVECAAAGIQVLLFDWNDSYPWSKLQEGQHHPLITVVRNWQEAEQEVARLAPMLAAAQAQQQIADKQAAAGTG